MTKKLSIIVPCHNEAENIPHLLNEYAAVVKRDDVEVVIVNDGSKDNTAEVLREMQTKYIFLKVVTNEIGQGYGGAIGRGLAAAEGEYIGWTHGDMQTPPKDVFTALEIIEKQNNPKDIYVKGQRYGRPLFDVFFTAGMSVLESIIFKARLWDINAQPNIFHRSFLAKLENIPTDFSLDLYMLVMAKQHHLKIVRFPVHFGPRLFGESKWNTGLLARYKFIKRTLSFSRKLRRTLNAPSPRP